MNWADLVVLAIIAISVVFSLVRGFVREVLSIVVWVLAFWLAMRLSGLLSALLVSHIESPTIRAAAAFGAIFVLVLVIGSLAVHFAGHLVGKTGLTGTDRMLGMLFGTARGLLIVALLVLLLGLTSVPQERWWRESAAITHMRPWVCRIGVSEWLDGMKIYTPLVHESVNAGGTRAASYWSEFCPGAARREQPEALLDLAQRVKEEAAERRRQEEQVDDPIAAFAKENHDTPSPAVRPRPASATKPAAPVRHPGFAVQVGSFSREDNALSLRDRLLDKGYPAFVAADEQGGHYRVRVGTVSERSQAEALRAQLKKELAINGLVVSHP